MNSLKLTCMLESDPVVPQFNPKVLAKDQFFEVNVQRQYGIFIVNDQEQWKIHYYWLLVVILPQEITFFDLFARSPKHYAMDKYLYEMKRQVIVNEMVLQGPLSNVCGEFCVFFGYFLCRRWRLTDIWKYFNDDLSFIEKAVYLQVQKLFPDHCRTL